MKQKFIRIMSIILVVTIVVQLESISFSAFDFDFVAEKKDNLDINVEGEIESERDESTKHFKMSDGTYRAVIYPEPVHYSDKDKWIEIDNNLKLIEKDGAKYYKNNKSNNLVLLGQNIKDGISMTNSSGFSISIYSNSLSDEKCLDDTNGKVCDVKNLISSTIEKDDINCISEQVDYVLKNKKSAFKYESIYNDVDLEYLLTPTSMKENIVFNGRRSQYIYSFKLYSKGLTPIKEQDGSVGLYNVNGNKKTVQMRIEAPYMYDSNGSFSDKVKISFTLENGFYIFYVCADNEWINDDSRKFPVVVDPTIRLDVGRSQINDTYVDTSSPNSVHLYDYYLYIGKNGLGKTRTYIKYNLPDLPDCSVVTGAQLVLQQYEYDPGNGTNNYIYAYDCGSNTWNSSSLTWNNQPMNVSNLSSYTALDYQIYKDNPNSTTAAAYSFNITKAAKNWYENGINNGIMLASADESITKRSRFCSSEYSTNSSFFPTVWVAYVNNTGIEDYWTYQTIESGRSGTAYISDYNGNLTYIHNDASVNGNRLSASINHVYSNDRTYFSGTYGNMKIGIGFRFDLLEKVEALSSSSSLYQSGYRMKYIDGDGTVHYFKSTSTTNKYVHEFNEKLSITKNSNNSYEMKDDKNNRKVFSTGGYLLNIIDSNNDLITISYNNNRITKISNTGTNKSISLTYDANNRLSTIKDADNRVTSFSFASGSDGVTSDYLRSITYPNGKSTIFYYGNPGGRLSQIVNYDTSEIDFTTKSITSVGKTFYRIATVISKSELNNSIRSNVNKLTYSYANGETKISDLYGKYNIISFDDAGRTVNVRDQSNNAMYSKYNTSGNKTNTLALSSDTYQSINNLVKNNSAELTGSEWYQQLSGATGSAEISSNEHYVGSKSFKVTNTSGTGRVNYCEALTLIPGNTYTLSTFVKTSDSLDGNGGVCLGYCYKDSNNVWQTVYGECLLVTSNWSRESFTFTLPTNATGSVGIMLILRDSSGSVYFDGVQLESGFSMNRYNLLNNSGFDYDFSYWASSNLKSNDAVISSGIEGKSFRVFGNPDRKKNIYQNIAINGSAGDTIVYGGWVEACAAGQSNSTSNDAFKLTLTIKYTDGTTAYASEMFNEDVNNRQYICASYKLTKPCNYIIFYYTYYGNINNAVIDNACMYIDNFGSSYQYDSDGKLVSVSDGTGQGIAYTYSGPDVSKISQKFNGEEKESCSYTYDTNHNVLTETTKGGVVTEYQYNPSDQLTFGNPTKVIVKDSNGQLQSSVEMTYSTNFDYLMKVKDSRNGETAYTYTNDNRGLLASETDPNGNVVTYTYDSLTDELTSTSGNNPLTSNNYSYVNSKLSNISHNGFNYGFNYDSLGRVTSTSVGNQTLISHSYNSNSTLASSTYGNGDMVSYTYDSLDRVSSETYNGVKKYSYEYNKEGQIFSERDYETPSSGYIETKYEYDLARRLSSVKRSNGETSNYTYDERNNIKHFTASKSGTKLSEFDATYKTDGLIDEVALPMVGNATLSYQHNSINRTTQKELYVNNVIGTYSSKFLADYTYLTNGINQTGLVNEINYSGFLISTANPNGVGGVFKSFSYTYDANGNIKTEFVDGVLQNTYTYDDLNQLVRHDDVKANKSYTYSYDIGGNITNKKEYAYTTGTLGTATKTTPYIYDTLWKDKLISYDGNAITYDEIGNPLTYDGYTYTWQKGRQLASISGNGTNLSFKYNGDGLRTKKISGETTTEYYYSGSTLVGQYDGTNWLKFIYSADGEIIGLIKNNTKYFYVKNVQGDVIAICNSAGNIYGYYEYDAWGNLLSVTDEDGDAITSATNIANINPVRYRGYYYDSETGLYYLKSRYYDPESKRFLNADNETDTGSKLLSTNLFQYSANNPVNNSDLDGHRAIKNLLKKTLGKVATYIHGKIVSYARKSKNRNGTKSVGLSASAFLGFGVGISIGATYDKRGNRGLYLTGSVYAGTPSASIEATYSCTTAPTIMKQKKESYGIGGSIGSVGAEYQLFVDEEDWQKFYHSFTISGSLSPVPAETHADYNYTVLYSYNIYDLEEKLYAKIME